jgi:hypothetical protein
MKTLDKNYLGYTEEELIKQFPDILMKEPIRLFDFAINGYLMELQKSENYPEVVCIRLDKTDYVDYLGTVARYFMKNDELTDIFNKYPCQGLGYTQKKAVKRFKAIVKKCFPFILDEINRD